MDENTRELICFEETRQMKNYYLSFQKYIQGQTDIMSDEEKEIFCKEIPKFSTKKVTLRVLCKCLGIDLPAKYENIGDEPQKVKFRVDHIKPGDVCVFLRSAEEFEMKRTTTKDFYEQAIEKGAKLIVMSRQDFEAHELSEEAFPVILVDKINERILRLFSILRKKHNEKVVMITGSVGKTTTKQLCDTVTANQFKTFVNAGNSNSVHRVAHHLLYKVNPKNEVYIQEAGAGYIGSVTLAGAMLQPDIFILTNVYKHHMENYRTLENVFEDKTGPDEFMKKDGIIITNYDDENIRNYSFKHQVKSFAIHYEDVDYRAINIQSDMDCLKFDVLEKSTGNTVKLNVKLQGEHNVYNILAAYVLAKTLGIKDSEIQKDLMNFRTEGIRQNLTNIGGIYFNVDCYNVAEESIVSMLKTGEQMKLGTGAKRYAIIGGENKLGDEASSRSFEFGRKLAGINVDKYLFCGVKKRNADIFNKYGDALSIQKGLKEVSDIPSRYSRRIVNIMRFLETNVKRNDLVMLKGIYHLNMTIAVDKVFGTSFSFGLPQYKQTTSKIIEGEYKANLIKQFGEVEVTKASILEGSLSIPEEIGGYPVFRIGEDAFKDNEVIQNIQFGNAVENIGANAFENCINLKKIVMPGNVKVIERNAFKGCTILESVLLQNGLTHIDEEVFQDCVNLKKIQIPDTVGKIADNAFENCNEMVIYCTPNSYAYAYAAEHNIPIETIEITRDKGCKRKRTHWWNRF